MKQTSLPSATAPVIAHERSDRDSVEFANSRSSGSQRKRDHILRLVFAVKPQKNPCASLTGMPGMNSVSPAAMRMMSSWDSYPTDADRFLESLRERLAKFGLELYP